MTKHSAGIVLVRKRNSVKQILLGHMGGPFWSKKDDHAWTVPKGEFDPGQEAPENAARREFKEETGIALDGNILNALRPIKASGKVLYFFTTELDIDPTTLKSNLFELEWPPRSGNMQSFPELDRHQWFTLDEARLKLVKGQMKLLDLIMSPE